MDVSASILSICLPDIRLHIVGRGGRCLLGNSMRHLNTRGEILYIYEQRGHDEDFGFEWFSTTRHEDGQFTLRSQCEIQSGFFANPSVLRDVAYTIDCAFRPIDCFVRLLE